MLKDYYYIYIITMNQIQAMDKIIEIDSQGVIGGFITEDSIFRYNKNMPTFEEPAEYKKDGVFLVQIKGNLFLSFRIVGTYSRARMYQYDFFDNKIVYWEGHTDEPIAPFKDGIPMSNVARNTYIEVENGENVNIICQYAFLDRETRSICYVFYNGNIEIKLEHQNNTLYKSYANSCNVLAPLTKCTTE